MCLYVTSSTAYHCDAAASCLVTYQVIAGIKSYLHSTSRWIGSAVRIERTATGHKDAVAVMCRSGWPDAPLHRVVIACRIAVVSLVATVLVNDVVKWLTGQVAAHVFLKDSEGALVVAVAATCNVRADNDVWELPQRMIVGQRLLVQHVQRSSGDALLL